MARYSVYWGLLSVCEDLVLLASCTSLYIVSDPFLHPRPPVFLFRFPNSFVTAWVSCCGVVMHEGHNASFDFEDGRYNDFPFRGGGDRCCYELIFGKYYDIFVVGFSLVGTRRSRECIWGCIGFSWYIKNFIVVFLKVRMPSGCSSVEILRGFPIL